MANQKSIPVTFDFLRDGVSSTIAFDLLSDVYSIPSQVPNWFSTDRKANSPVGVFVVSSTGYSASLLGNIVTITLDSSLIASGLLSVVVNLLF